MNDAASISLSGGKIYTLAQNGTGNSNLRPRKRPITVYGTGADLMDKATLQSRAKRKQVTQALILSLIDIAQKEGNEKLLKTLWNMYYCLHEVHVTSNRVHGKYCKNRLCTVCLCIRKAELINKYLPIIQTWEKPYFLTLTIKSVSKERLHALMRNMLKGIKRIILKYRKRHGRKQDIMLIGIRSLECEFNPRKKTYNPHFHIIVYNRQIGEILKREWLIESKKKSNIRWTEHWCQKLKPINNTLGCFIEIIKYGSKIFTEPDIEKKGRNKTGNRIIYAKALYTILEAMQGLRLFDRFGFNLPPTSRKKEPVTKILQEYRDYTYNPSKVDWIEPETDSVLTEYTPDPKVTYVLENCINTDLY